MPKLLSFLLLPVLVMTLASCSQTPVNPIDGTWKLTEMTVTENGVVTPIESLGTGILILSGGWYSHIWMESDRLYSDPPTELEKLHAYDAFDASAGTYTLKNQQLTFDPQVARDPRSVGKPTSTMVKLEGDKMTRTKEQPNRDKPSEMMQWTSVYTRIK